MSNIDPKFKIISNFETADADRLGRQLPTLEDNINNALSSVAGQALPRFTPTNLKTAAYVAKLDELVVCAGTFGVTLPVASALNAGRHIAVAVKSGTVTVSVQNAPSGKVNDAATYTCAADALFDFVSDGVGWRAAVAGSGGGVTSVSGGASPLVTVSPTTGAVVVSGNEDRVKIIASYHP